MFDFKYGLMTAPYIKLDKLQNKIDSLKPDSHTTSLSHEQLYGSALPNYKKRYDSILKGYKQKFKNELQQMTNMMNEMIMESPTGKKLNYYIKEKRLKPFL